MKLTDVMTRNVETIPPDATLRLAAQRMEELNVGALPVCDGSKLIGVVTDRDITVRAVSVGAAPDENVVADCMSADALYAFEDESIEEALDRMRSAQVRRLMVIDRDKRLVGVVSLGDIATKSPGPEAAAALEDISTPSKPDRAAPPKKRSRRKT